MGVNMLSAFQGATRNAASTLLLMRIVFWVTKSSCGVTLEGHVWIANSLEDWAGETGLTVTQVTYALGILRDLNLVITTRRMWNKRMVLHTRITGRVAVVLGGGDWQKCQEHNGKTAMTIMAKLPCTYIQGETQGETQGAFGALSLASGKKSDQKACGEDDMKFTGSAHDVEAHVKANKMLHKPDGGFGQLWAENLSRLTGVTQPMPSLKQIGQLKAFAKKCPPETGKAVLKNALANWLAFTKRVEQDAGIKTTPAKPNIDFLLKHVSIAVMFALPAQQSKQPAKHEALSVAKTMQLTSLSAEDEPPMTLAEIHSEPTMED